MKRNVRESGERRGVCLCGWLVLQPESGPHACEVSTLPLSCTPDLEVDFKYGKLTHLESSFVANP